jgi:hypothetical protein
MVACRRSGTPLFTFKYDATAPDKPASVNPGCVAGDGVWQHTCDDPNFTWSGASDRAGSGVAGYNIYGGTSLTGTSPATGTTAAAYNPPAVPSGVLHHLHAQTADHVDNWSEWTTLFSLQFDGQPPLISDTIPANGSVITSAWPVISATLTDPAPGSGV